MSKAVSLFCYDTHMLDAIMVEDNPVEFLTRLYDCFVNNSCAANEVYPLTILSCDVHDKNTKEVLFKNNLSAPDRNTIIKKCALKKLYGFEKAALDLD